MTGGVGELGGFGEWFEGDAVAQGVELADCSGFGGGGLACGVVVGAGVAVELAVGEQVPGGDDHGVFDGDNGAHGSAPGGDAFVFGREVGVLRACRRERGDAEDAFEVAVAGPGLAGFDPAGGLVGSRGQPGPGCQVPGGGEHAHIPAGFGDEYLGGDAGEPGNADQQVPGGAKGFHRRLDALVEAGDVGAVGVDAVQEQPGHERVVLAEPAGQRFGQGGDLRAHPPLGQVGQRGGVALAGDERFEHRPPGDPGDLGGHRGQFDAGVFE